MSGTAAWRLNAVSGLRRARSWLRSCEAVPHLHERLAGGDSPAEARHGPAHEPLRRRLQLRGTG